MKHVVSISKMPAKAALGNEICLDSELCCPGGGTGILSPILALVALLFKGEGKVPCPG